MRAALGLLLLLGVACGGLVAADWQKPEFCRDRDCPRFDVRAASAGSGQGGARRPAPPRRRNAPHPAG